jgi:V8-like Glu-specific endopeptidase
MGRHLGSFLFLVALSYLPVQAYALAGPSLVGNSSLAKAPYRDIGIFYSYSAGSTTMMTGSACLVGKRAVVTAAHLVFNKETLAWNTKNGFVLAYNDSLRNLPANSFSGVIRIKSYSEQIQADKAAGYTANFSSFKAFNSDICTVYALKDQSEVYSVYSIMRKGTQSLAAEGYSSMLLGYPVDATAISAANRGKMHLTGPGKWALEDYFGDNDGKTLVYTNDTVATYEALYLACDTMNVYPGNSGGPLFVYDEDEDRYVATGILVGTGTTDGSQFAAFRVFDSTTAALIREATYYSGASEILNYPNISASRSNGVIVLIWSPLLNECTRTTSGHTGWEISRNDGDGWHKIAVAKPSDTTFTDRSGKPGIQYTYRVRSLGMTRGDWTNAGPWSACVTPDTFSSPSEELATAVKAPYLYVTSGGNAPFVAEEGGASSGKLLNHQESWMKVSLYGPGTLSFTWSTDCEAPDEYGDTDYAEVYIEGQTQPIATLSGSTQNKNITVPIKAAGVAKVVIRYAKNGFGKSGADRVTVSDMSYFYAGQTASLPGGVPLSENHFVSPLIGEYYDFTGKNWIYGDLGYVYVDKPSNFSDWESGKTLWVYLMDSKEFGWVCAPMELWPWMWSAEKGWVYYMGGRWFWVEQSSAYEEL